MIFFEFLPISFQMKNNDPPPRGQHPAGRKIYSDPLFSENASKNTAIFFNVSFCRMSPLKVNHDVI